MHARLPAVPESIALPSGMRAAGLHCGLKADGSPDLGLLVTERPVAAAALFTDNRLLGAHIPVCRDHLRRSGARTRAILVNSRNANCATGQRGIDDAYRCCAELARRIGCPTEQVLMASTGPIGAPLPAERIIAHLDDLVARAEPTGGMDFARAIMTTDTQPKAAHSAGEVAATGFAKGSGMIHPDMATMLGFLLVDAQPTGELRPLLQAVADRSFHRISVDGDTSPNDSLFLLADPTRSTADDAVRQPLEQVATALARQVAGDGEGATRLVTIEVRGAPDETAATRIGRTIATSMLTKTAVAGRDPNWGRILAAAGRCGIAFEPAQARVWVGPTTVFANGVPHPEREAEASDHLTCNEAVVLGIDLGAGNARADVWTCDLTADYVRINADYRT